MNAFKIFLSFSLVMLSATVGHCDPKLSEKDSFSASAAQSTVASKGSFKTIKTPNVKNTIKATDLAKATSLEGKKASFEGTVSKLFVPKSNSIVVLDFAADYDTAVTAVVFSKDYKKFPDLTQLAGKTVQVSGQFSAYEGKPEMILSDAKQVKIVQ